MENAKFIYLEFGGSVIRRRELRYSIRTLLAESPAARNNIVIYTDSPASYAADADLVEAVDLSPRLSKLLGGYPYRAKPCLLLEALRAYGRPCILLDTDTFIRPGFERALKQKFERGAVMNAFVRRNPYPESVGFEADLPHSGVYRYEAAAALMYNSGLIALRPCYAPVLEDAIVLMDALQPLTAHLTHDQEQFAIGEALRVHGVYLDVLNVELVHYCPRWSKRYMAWRLGRMPELDSPIAPARPCIALNKSIARGFKFATLSRKLLSSVTGGMKWIVSTGSQTGIMTL